MSPTSSLPAAVTHLRGGELSTLQTLCRTSTGMRSACQLVRLNRDQGHHRRLTRVAFFKSLLTYLLNTLTATSCPRYSHFHTSPNPPPHNAFPVGISGNLIRSGSGSRMWPAHVLYNDFRHFFRFSDARLRLSNAYQGGQWRRQAAVPPIMEEW